MKNIGIDPANGVDPVHVHVHDQDQSHQTIIDRTTNISETVAAAQILAEIAIIETQITIAMDQQANQVMTVITNPEVLSQLSRSRKSKEKKKKKISKILFLFFNIVLVIIYQIRKN